MLKTTRYATVCMRSQFLKSFHLRCEISNMVLAKTEKKIFFGEIIYSVRSLNLHWMWRFGAAILLEPFILRSFWIFQNLQLLQLLLILRLMQYFSLKITKKRQ